MKQTQEQIEKLKTLQETSDFWADVAENQLPALADKIDNIDLTPIENKVDEGVSALSTKIDNIDLSSVAKQGDNKNATNSKILEEVQKIPNLKNIYSARFEKNDDGEDTYSMVLPIVAGVIANEDGETVTIKL
jgi:hypothetical protein